MSEVTYATRDQFLDMQRRAVRYKDHEIPGLGVVRLRSLNDKQYTEISTAAMKNDGTVDRVIASTFNTRLIAACVVDEDGNRIFKPEDVKQLREMDAAIIDDLGDVIRKHVGVKTGDELKNLSATLGED